MDKKIIGYRLKDEYKKYETIATQIAYGNDLSKKFSDSNSNKRYDFQINSVAYSSLIKAGVLDIWFQPVYESQKKVFDLNNSKVVIIDADKKTISIDGDSVIFPEFIAWYKEFILPIIITKNHSSSKLGNWDCGDLSISIGCIKNIKIDEIKEVYDYIYSLI